MEKRSTHSASVGCVHDANASLGESTFWDPKAQCLWWIDIIGKMIYRYEPSNGATTKYPTPESPGCVAVREKGGLVMSMTSGFFFFDPEIGRFDPIVDPEAEVPETRFNDGKTDRQGRFWSGSMFDAPDVKPKNIASLYRLDKDLSCHRVVEGVVCSNGLAWSPDSRQMYYTDSYGSVVWQWDFDALTGCVDNRRVFIDLTAEKEFVDGATVDSDGCYWATIPYKGKVQQYDPTGKLMRVITLPADLPTCCEFGGPNLEILYVTTATLGRKATLLAGQSQPGGLFAVETGSTGLTLPPFAG